MQRVVNTCAGHVAKTKPREAVLEIGHDQGKEVEGSPESNEIKTSSIMWQSIGPKS